ncbi:hypothetical protein HOD75_03110 [archaeon]|jgi:deoxyribonuclease V|nr:hypothetical protein [archaeon]MBT4241862.1 hypothetical protein [archaeon]MBT4418409.1 hypothetical protein [archaeon]
MEKSGKITRDELIKKYGIDVAQLEQEQLKLAKELVIKNKIDFKLADKFGGFDNTFIGNKILSCVIVCDKDFEIIDRAYALEKIKFPYLPEFRNYRELEAMMIAFEKLTERPDVVLIPGQGISHLRLGLASHFSLATGVPSIGVANVVLDCEIKGEGILKEGKEIGNTLVEKEGSRPMYVSPGNLIDVKTAYEVSKSLIKPPHKRPEPLHLVAKYAKQVRKELA